MAPIEMERNRRLPEEMRVSPLLGEAIAHVHQELSLSPNVSIIGLTTPYLWQIKHFERARKKIEFALECGDTWIDVPRGFSAKDLTVMRIENGSGQRMLHGSFRVPEIAQVIYEQEEARGVRPFAFFVAEALSLPCEFLRETIKHKEGLVVRFHYLLTKKGEKRGPAEERNGANLGFTLVRVDEEKGTRLPIVSIHPVEAVAPPEELRQVIDQIRVVCAFFPERSFKFELYFEGLFGLMEKRYSYLERPVDKLKAAYREQIREAKAKHNDEQLPVIKAAYDYLMIVLNS